MARLRWLRSIEDKMSAMLSGIGDMNKNQVSFQKELHSLHAYAQVFIILGIGGLVTLIIYGVRALGIM